MLTASPVSAQALSGGWVQPYNHTRLHRAGEDLTPAEDSRGNPTARSAERHAKVLAARQRRPAAGEAFYEAARSAGG